ncbi:hypothetical protein CTAM01_06047 [Colletotrichum tamarilloi]|uniref:Uncharacterized protein n=1 Tax=Colletotrichum tamarilloi TaxID=1209934 RepID=A0ABQ9RCW4_9PEZI|nr:uncharacterized protein CTAM01_06047 [Colletotrichum tamarilloi]KAK1501322.1 hypothetical protein CTAM01_06047 [Colletotrichum tamarilloi]
MEATPVELAGVEGVSDETPFVSEVNVGETTTEEDDDDGVRVVRELVKELEVEIRTAEELLVKELPKKLAEEVPELTVEELSRLPVDELVLLADAVLLVSAVDELELDMVGVATVLPLEFELLELEEVRLSVLDEAVSVL